VQQQRKGNLRAYAATAASALSSLVGSSSTSRSSTDLAFEEIELSLQRL
jgi:hypothetical protein